MRRFIYLLFPLVFLVAASKTAAAEHRFFVHVDASHSNEAGESPEQLLERLGLRSLRRVANGDGNIFVVTSTGPLPSSVVQEILDSEPRIRQIESVRRLRMSETNGFARRKRDSARHRAESFAREESRASPHRRYRSQGLKRRLRLGGVHRYYTGAGVVAIIDTGVDPEHPSLVGSLVPGYDFVLRREGASEWTELDPSLAAQLQQSTVAVLDQSTVAVLDHVAILNQSTVAVLDQEMLDRLSSDAYSAFGHGTLVAGLVHLVAPGAAIMPLKAFRPDGTSSTDDIVEAIYYAVAHGADVINMSFSFPSFSPEVMRAVNFATRNGVICVSAAGNLSAPVLVYPASLANVTGVAAVSVDRELSSLSNFGEDLVSIATLGEDVLTTYPGGRYASVFGTSFAAAIVTGAMAILRDVDADINQYEAEAALAMGRRRSGDLGHGELNLPGAIRWLKRTRSGRDHDDGNDD